MYRAVANLKLNTYIYRYYIGAGALTYFAAPHFFKITNTVIPELRYNAKERSQMKKLGLYNPERI